MSLKELTSANHRLAEKTPFMKALLTGKMPINVWADYTYNKMLWYGAIESKARAEGFLDDLPDIDRAYKLYQDYKEMTEMADYDKTKPAIGHSVVRDYQQYILDLEPGLVLAHLYVWHMGDLHGGQRIKEVVAAPNRNLTFKDVEGLKEKIRAKLSDNLGDEANRAFEWTIKILNDFPV